MGYKLNMMTHGLEKKSPQLPLGVEVLSFYATLTMGSNRITVVLRNNTNEWLEVQKGVPIARMVTANMISPADLSSSRVKTLDAGRMSLEERQQMLFEKLDLSGLESWDAKAAKQARSLLAEYHNLFSLEKNKIRCTKAAVHIIELKDPDGAQFKEWFRRTLPPQVNEVREHLKLMLDMGAIQPSNSPWCNAVVLVRKKDDSLRFCIDFRRLNSLTEKDSHSVPRICETLNSLIGAAYFSTFNLTSGFWQVPMAEESKQFTAFTLGSMGLFECDRMPFGLCNAPATFQRLMQNCLGELNLTYCLIYLDDVIVYFNCRFDCLREHGLKLKPTKCDLFRTELIYLAHHVSKDGVRPSKKNVTSIIACLPPKTYMTSGPLLVSWVITSASLKDLHT